MNQQYEAAESAVEAAQGAVSQLGRDWPGLWNDARALLDDIEECRAGKIFTRELANRAEDAILRVSKDGGARERDLFIRTPYLVTLACAEAALGIAFAQWEVEPFHMQRCGHYLTCAYRAHERHMADCARRAQQLTTRY